MSIDDLLCIRASKSKATSLVSAIFLNQAVECKVIPTCLHWLVVAVQPLQQATAKQSSVYATDQQKALFWGSSS